MVGNLIIVGDLIVVRGRVEMEFSSMLRMSVSFFGVTDVGVEDRLKVPWSTKFSVVETVPCSIQCTSPVQCFYRLEVP